MAMKRIVITLAALLIWQAAARAEYADDPGFQVCTNATGYYDVAATNDWLQRLRTSDASAMAEVAGKWYAEFHNQQLNMDYNNVITYLDTGVMDFTTRTCSSAYGMRTCSDDYGHGIFTAHRDANGWIFVTRNLTSLTRINEHNVVTVIPRTPVPEASLRLRGLGVGPLAGGGAQLGAGFVF